MVQEESKASGVRELPPGQDLVADADKLIERWTARQSDDGGKPEAAAQDPSSPPVPAPTNARPGVEVQRLETFPWKGLLWQVCGFAKIIADGEEASNAVVIRALAPVAHGSRAERRAARRRGQKVRG